MRFLVWEYASGGGLWDQKVDASLLVEGYAMLYSMAGCLWAAGHEVVTILDARMSGPMMTPSGCHRRSASSPMGPDELGKAVTREDPDAALIIAPETGMLLSRFVREVEATGTRVLNCSPGAIGDCTDKLRTLELLEGRGVRVPRTEVVDISDGDTLPEMAPPFVVKPRDGVACEGMSLVRSVDALPAALECAATASDESTALVQEYIKGADLSLSLLASGGGAKVVSVNRQVLEAPLTYMGATVPYGPFPDVVRERLVATGLACAEAVPGLFGPVGVDLVLADGVPYVVEVNPRLTTSFVAMAQIPGFGVLQARALVGLLNDEHVPVPPPARHCSVLKVALGQNTPVPRDLLCTPPVSIDGTAGGMVFGLGRNPTQAEQEALRHKRTVEGGV